MADETKPEGQGETQQGEGKTGFTVAQITELMKENADFKKKAKALEKANEEREAATLKEQGNFKAVADAAEKKVSDITSRLKRAELKAFAMSKGISNTAFVDLIDISKINIDDATGELTGTDAIIAAFSGMTGGNPPGQQPGKPATPGTRAMSAVAPGSFDEFNKLPPEIRNEWATKHPAEFSALCNQAKYK